MPKETIFTSEEKRKRTKKKLEKKFQQSKKTRKAVNKVRSFLGMKPLK